MDKRQGLGLWMKWAVNSLHFCVFEGGIVWKMLVDAMAVFYSQKHTPKQKCFHIYH